jgi:hypothetical protein
MILGAITGVPTPACLSAASNPVEAVTPPCGAGTNIGLGEGNDEGAGGDEDAADGFRGGHGFAEE